MRVSSFDIFDTCVVRKCGTPRNLFDVLSYRVFSEKVSDRDRIDFIIQRLSSDESSTLDHLYETFCYSHPFLIPKTEIKQQELECEREMVVPVKSMLDEVQNSRNRGDHIIFISDMYLPTAFLQSLLLVHGFFAPGDSLYVSGDVGKKKSDGSLFSWIKETEGLSYDKWIHFGDNENGDFTQPKRFGIEARLIKQDYLPYEKEWINQKRACKYNYCGIMAGIGRSIALSSPPSIHNAFAIDISAPLLTTFACRILKDATKRGIKRLFFCSRDCYSLWVVAKRLSAVFPYVDSIYLHISRQALYESDENEKIAYYESLGLASTKEISGMVDIRSTGGSLAYISEFLCQHKFQPVIGYYFDLFCSGEYIADLPPYYCEINSIYYSSVLNIRLSHHWPIFETFIAIANEPKTIGYKNAQPITEVEDKPDCYIEDIEKLSETNERVIRRFVDDFISTGLFHYADILFETIVFPTLIHFFNLPKREYLHSLTHLYIKNSQNEYIPYIEKKSVKAMRLERALEKAKTRNCRRMIRLVMKLFKITPIVTEKWWPEGTRAYNEEW